MNVFAILAVVFAVLACIFYFALHSASGGMVCMLVAVVCVLLVVRGGRVG
jgi:hypothetical protein